MSNRPETDPHADDDGSRLRVPPHSVESEQSLLGALLWDNLSWDKAADLLKDSDFFRHEHRLIYSAIGSLVNANKPADVITVFEQLQSLGKAADCGGLAYLNAVAQSVPTANNIRQYAERVRECAHLRKLISAGDDIATQAFNPQGRPAAEIQAKAESQLHAIGDDRAHVGHGLQPVGKLAVAMLDHINDLAENGADEVTGLRTGFYDLDRMTSGLQKGDLIVAAARPSMGKSAFAINMAEYAAVSEGLPVLVFSMEMSAAQVTSRVMGSIGRIDQQQLRTGRLQGDGWDRLAEASDKIAKAPMFIDESPALTVAALKARATRKARELGGTLGLIVVDYLQLMADSGNGRSENRATELGAISRGLKALAKELQCPVVALSQLSRGVESRNDKRPLMSDLRDSGAIEQDADVIMFIYRDEYYNKDSKEPGVAEIVIGKQRNGPVGTVKLGFTKPLTKFENLAPADGDACWG